MKFYWGKDHQMWNYCIPLGPFISENGAKYDLGAYVVKKYNEFSFAIVYGEEDWEYISGDVDFWIKNAAKNIEFLSSISA